MGEDSHTVSFGELDFKHPELISCETFNAVNQTPSARIVLDPESPALHSLALNESVSVRLRGQGVFSGDVVSAGIENGRLTVCCGLPQFHTMKTSVLSRAHPAQIIRLLISHTGFQMGDSDASPLCRAKNRGLDWDALVQALDVAEDHAVFVAAIDRHVAAGQPTWAEQQQIAEILVVVRRAIERSSVGQLPGAPIPRNHYEDVLPDIWGLTWRFRTEPDPYEVVAPLRGVRAPKEPLCLGPVSFVDSVPSAGEVLDGSAGRWLRDEWAADAYACTQIDAEDMWTAKQAGLSRIRDALTSIGFTYGFSALQQKIDDHRYQIVDYHRPAGAPGVLGNVVRVVGTRSNEYWLGSVKGAPDPCDLSELALTRSALLTQSSCQDESNELLRHVKRAMSWRYRGLLADLPVDAFLYTWLSLEMLFQRPKEDASALIRRLAYVMLSGGEKASSVRREIEKRWIPLRNEIVHQAVLAHPSVDAGLRRVHFFSDCAIGFALERAQVSASFDDWLLHLDELSRRRPKQSSSLP